MTTAHAFDPVGRICSCGVLCGVVCDNLTYADHLTAVRAQALRDASALCACGHVFAEHLTPGTECVAVTGKVAIEDDDYCMCSCFRRAEA